MTNITTRSGKGSPLTWDEVDGNFTGLNAAKAENTDLSSTTAGKGLSLIGDSTSGTNAQTSMDARMKSATLAAAGGAALVGYNYANSYASGTVGYSIQQEKCLKADFGAKGDGATDDTAAINAALASGYSFRVPAGSYMANNLTGSTTGQRIRAIGNVNIIKNANGPLLTHSGGYIELYGINFVGTGYTGDNVVLTGNHPRIIFCGSVGTPGRALKATGAQVQIYGTCNSYTTTGTTTSDYDIEIGVSGTATLYHMLVGIYTSQKFGGILMTDTGSAQIVGGQFYKLTVVKGAGGFLSGCNGGTTVGSRILGDVFMSQSNASFEACQFDSVGCNFTFDTGTTYGVIGQTCTPPATYTNNGTASGVTANRNYSPGGVGGDNNFTNVTLPNAGFVNSVDTGAVSRAMVGINSSNNLAFGGNYGNSTLLQGSSGGIYAVVAGSTIAQWYSGGLRPQTDNTSNLGTAAQRWANLYATIVNATTASVTNVNLPNAGYVNSVDTGSVSRAMVGINSGNNLLFGGNYGNSTYLSSSSGGIYMIVGGSSIGQWYSGGLRPQTDNVSSLGTSSQRWQNVYSMNFTLPNAGFLSALDTGAVSRGLVGISAANVLSFGANAGAYTAVYGSSGGIYMSVGGSSIGQWYSGGLRPQADNSSNLGTAAQRWSYVYTTNLKLSSVTVATLPAAGTAGAGARAFVSDSTVAASGNFGATVAGGGTNAVPVFSNGTNWLIG